MSDHDDEEIKKPVHYSWVSFNFEDGQDEKLVQFYEKYCKYLAWGIEICPTTKNKHRQGHIWLRSGNTMTALQKYNKKIGLTMQIKGIRKSAIANITYCAKDGEHTVYGEPPAQGKRSDIVAFIADAQANPKKRKIDVLLEFPTLYCKYPRYVNELRMLISKANRQKYNLQHDNDHWPNLWVCGPPGCSKSRDFQEAADPPYLKMQNKWWDGFDNEDVVLIEDFDMNVLGGLMKIWADRYSFPAETKGGTIWIRPKQIIVTTNYTIEELFPHDPKLCRAINRRFIVRDLF